MLIIPPCWRATQSSTLRDEEATKGSFLGIVLRCRATRYRRVFCPRSALISLYCNTITILLLQSHHLLLLLQLLLLLLLLLLPPIILLPILLLLLLFIEYNRHHNNGGSQGSGN